MKIKLSETDDNVFMEACIADKVGDFVRKAIPVIPGGGYAELCSERGGEPVGMVFMPYGYNYFVLHYSVNRVKRYPINTPTSKESDLVYRPYQTLLCILQYSGKSSDHAACKIAGTETIPAVVAEIEDDQAAILLVDSNLQ